VNVEISKRARRDAIRFDAWWREHRDSRELFAQEFQEAIDLLETEPAPGTAHPTTRRPNLRRVLLMKTKRHVYFEIFEREQVARILCVWGAPRERGPKL
jgi:ParE-like toxin of type II ParDE toxin-antitoxin system